MNVIADKLASSALKEGCVGNTKGHARNGPERSIEGRTITSNYAKELRKAAEREELEK